jgi:ribosomal protein S18 acetylase RimI-like enzyme
MMRISVENQADPQDVQTVERGLEAFNHAHTGVSSTFERISIFVRDDDGAIQGGLLGGTYWGWLYISIVWLHDEVRGQGYGQQLVRMAEGIARGRGCHHAHLDTMSFQALGFYRKLGYEEFGRLEDLPPGHSRIFLKKAL